MGHNNAANPAWLREMPTVERVTAEIKGDSEIDTFARRSGAFNHLSTIIARMALLQNRDEKRLTADEKRLVGIYAGASIEAWKPVRAAIGTIPPGEQRNRMNNYATDAELRMEVLEKFFSADFRALYAKADVVYAKDLEEFRQRQKVREATRAQTQAQPSGGGATDAGTLEMRRCVAGGRGIRECFAEMMGNQLSGVNPNLATKQPPPGLRLSGKYRGNGLDFEFANRSEGVSRSEYFRVPVKCGNPLGGFTGYTLTNTGTSIVLKLATSPPVEFVMQPNGSWKGPGVVVIDGVKIIGHGPEEQVTRTVADYGKPIYMDRTGGQLLPGDTRGYFSGFETRTETVTVRPPITAPVKVPCDFTGLELTGPATDVTSIGQGFGFQEIPPGLRMVGTYTGAGGLSIKFHPESATTICGESEWTDKYSVVATGKEILISLQNGKSPYKLVLRPDGTLVPTASGAVTVAGRVMTGMNGAQPIYAPTPPVSCQLTALSPRMP